ncbi:DNA_repair helicase [Hexamita inflata]|uniref:DNA repair helicase n=1 Tax=Hexamita inflata TaxID=28002 RepID=A0AA86TN72_9EUKA|nr:DNA repair helicase [Hexamita inflata]
MTITIDKFSFKFPFTPYPQQLQYMGDLLHTLKKSQNAALEAQTGFGKTLCVICVCSQFINQCQTLKRKLMMSEQLSDTDIYFIKSTNLFNGVQIAENKQAIPSIPFEQIFIPKLIYTSRTHSQLQQVSRVMKSLAVPHVTLGSRQQYCANDECKKFATKMNLSLNQCCLNFQRLGNCIMNQALNIQAAVEELKIKQQNSMDFEDYYSYSKHEFVCPYYLAKASIDTQSTVLSPYNYIINTQENQTLLSNNIVIMDEAHNIPGVCCEEFSTQFHFSDVEDSFIAIQYINALILHQKDKTIGKVSDIEKMTCDQGIVQNIQDFLKSLYFNLKELIQDNIQTFNLKADFNTKNYVTTNFFDILKKVDLSTFRIDMLQGLDQLDFYLNQSQERQSFKVQSRLQYISAIVQIFCACKEISPNFQQFGVIIEKSEQIKKVQVKDHKSTPAILKKYDQQLRQQRTSDIFDSITINIVCYSPDVATSIITKQKPLSIIATSGTLSPLQNLSEEFCLQFQKIESYPHVCKSTNVNSIIISSHSQIPIVGSFQNRTSSSYINSINYLVQNTQSHFQKGGALIFFQSYAAMNSFKQNTKTLGLFFEQKGVEENKIEFARFQNQINNQQQAIMCCVFNGKFSEGVDFYDQQCRLVACISIPFAAALSSQLQEKMKYFDRFSKVKGRVWYELQAFRSVNQACGRAIRHADDFGEILLFDQRFEKNKHMMSKWVSQNIQIQSCEQWAQSGWLNQKIQEYVPKQTKQPSCQLEIQNNSNQLQNIKYPQQTFYKSEFMQKLKQPTIQMSVFQKFAFKLQIKNEIVKILNKQQNDELTQLIKEQNKDQIQIFSQQLSDDVKEMIRALLE